MIEFPKSMGPGQGQALDYRSAVRRNRLNISLVTSAEVEVETFLSNRVKLLHELQSVLDLLCLLPS